MDNSNAKQKTNTIIEWTDNLRAKLLLSDWDNYAKFIIINVLHVNYFVYIILDTTYSYNVCCFIELNQTICLETQTATDFILRLSGTITFCGSSAFTLILCPLYLLSFIFILICDFLFCIHITWNWANDKNMWWIQFNRWIGPDALDIFSFCFELINSFAFRWWLSFVIKNWYLTLNV